MYCVMLRMLKRTFPFLNCIIYSFIITDQIPYTVCTDPYQEERGKRMTTSPKPMTASERVHAAIAGEQVDRVPFCFWHHFKPDGSGERMAKLNKEFFSHTVKRDI